MSNDLRRWIKLCEATLPPDILVSAAKRMSEITWATSGFMDICYSMRDDGYLTDADVQQAANDGNRFSRSPEFKAKLVQWSKDEVAAVFDRLEQMFRNGRLAVWREIIAPVDWQPDEHPGLYWSWDEDGAEAHWDDGAYADNGVAWLLQAHLTFDQIDWVSTLAQNASPAYADEKEITVLRTADVEIDHYEKRP
jgi:hypothetical protein